MSKPEWQVVDADVIRHDLRNQLNHLVGYGELLLEDLGGSAGAVAAVLEKICGDSRQSAAFLDALDQGRSGAEWGDLPAVIAVVARQFGDLIDVLQGAGLSDFAVDVGRMEMAVVAAAEMAEKLVTCRPPPAGRGLTRPTGRALRRPAGGGRERGPAAGELILVVDDDEDNRDLLARRLEKLGYRVVVAENGVQALGMLETEPVELVLLDLMMPEMDGFEVLEQRNGDTQMAETPVVMISSENDIASIVRCVEMGADDYLAKPFEPALLEARVRTSLEKKRLRDNERRLLARLREQTQLLSELNVSLETRVSSQVEEINSLARLRRFLSPQLADLVVSSGEDVLRSHRRQIAVLFCDLRGFTSFSETAEPEEVMDVLHDFHTAIGELTHRFGATVGFFAGDGIMVFFNDPLPCPNPPEQAVKLAVALNESMAPMRQEWQRRDHRLGIGVGISYGYATLGEIGFQGRYDYGVIGSVVNLAARLCDHAGDGQILVSRRAYLAVEDLAESEEIGPITFKGFHAPVTVFNVVGLRAPASAR